MVDMEKAAQEVHGVWVERRVYAHLPRITLLRWKGKRSYQESMSSSTHALSPCSRRSLQRHCLGS